MSHRLARIILDDDREESDDHSWHLVDDSYGVPDPMILCNGMYIELGAGCGEYEVKKVKRGGITCEACLLTLKYYKSIKL